MTGFHCRSCGEFHDDLPLVFGPDAPDAWASSRQEDLAADDELGSDNCHFAGRYFIRGTLDIPIEASGEHFRWLVWIEVTEDDMFAMTDVWEMPGRENDPPYAGRLANALPLYPSTLDLVVTLHTQPIGQRPQVRVSPSPHPLATQQQQGLTWPEVHRSIERLMHF